VRIAEDGEEAAPTLWNRSRRRKRAPSRRCSPRRW
jgi:hypothetical protein